MVIDFSTYYDMPRNLDSFFDELWRPSSLSQRRIAYPPVNISEGTEVVIVTSEIPGMDKDDVELTLNEKSLIIRGNKKAKWATTTDRNGRRGIFSGSLTLMFRYRQMRSRHP